MQRRYDDGEQCIGIKLGFTSRAKMIQMGVDSLIWGWLTDAMLGQPLRSLVQATRLLHEAECVLLAGSLVMAGAATAAEALHPGTHVSVEILGFGESSFSVRP